MTTEDKDHISVIYEPNRLIKQGLFWSWSMMFQELLEARELGTRLFIRDFSAKYKQQLLGNLWIVINPLIYVVLALFMKNKVMPGDFKSTIPFEIYVFMGTSIYLLIQNLVTVISTMVASNIGLMRKINFPRIALAWSPIMTSLLDFVIRMTILFVYVFFNDIEIQINYIGFLFIIPGIILGIGLGFFCSIIGSVFRDFGNILAHIFQFIIWLTPILYSMDQLSISDSFIRFNPFYYLVVVPRDMIFGNSQPLIWNSFMIVSLFTLMVFFAGWRFYHVSIPRIVEKI